MPMGSKIFGQAAQLLKDSGKAIKTNMGSIKGLSDEVLKREVDALSVAAQTMHSLNDSDLLNLAKKTGFDVSKAGDNLRGNYKSYVDEKLSAALEAQGQGTAKALAQYKGGGIGGNIKGVASQAAQYYWHGASGAQRATRIGVTAGAYMGGATMLRGMSSIGTNSNGERDIAGIPFL